MDYKTLLTLPTVLLISCGTSYTETDLNSGISVYSESGSINAQQFDHYTSELHTALQNAYGAGPADLNFLQVYILEDLDAYGYWYSCCSISVLVGPTQLATYGHEFVRFYVNYHGRPDLANQSSLDWSGTMGQLWNIAENLAIKEVSNE